MTSGRSDWWYCCFWCSTKLAPFSGLFKELLSHCTPKSRCLLIRGNCGTSNLKFAGQPAYAEPHWVAPVALSDEGLVSNTYLACIFCAKCGRHFGWKIMKEFSGHPIVRPGQYILRIDSENPKICWDGPGKTDPCSEADGRRNG